MSKIVIIGGGAAGTAAAYRLKRLGHDDVTIIEKQSELGGRIHSMSYDGVPIEMGASFISPKLYSNTFSVIYTSPLINDLKQRNRVSTFVRNGIEYSPKSLISSAWLSWGARRALIGRVLYAVRHRKDLDLHQFWPAARYDTESVAESFKSRSEQELLQYFIQPMLDGFFYTPSRMSNALLMMLLNSARQMGASFTLGNGLQQIPKHMASQTTQLLSAEVDTVMRNAKGKYSLQVRQKDGLHTIEGIDGIVCATTATVVPRLFEDLNPNQLKFFAGISYSSTVVAARCYLRKKQVKEHTVAYPHVENEYVAATSSHSMRNQQGQNIEVIKSYASGGIGSALVTQDDATIIETLQNPLKLGDRTLDKANPDEVLIQKWPEALPEFRVGHIKSLAKFQAGDIEDKDQKLVFAGDYIGGPFIEGAISSGFMAAERLSLVLKTQQH